MKPGVPTGSQFGPARDTGWRARWFEIIFRHDPGAPRRFDLLLIAAIVASVVVVILDSEAGLHARWGRWFYLAEWGFTLLFTAEYAVRLMVVRRPPSRAKMIRPHSATRSGAQSPRLSPRCPSSPSA